MIMSILLKKPLIYLFIGSIGIIIIAAFAGYLGFFSSPDKLILTGETSLSPTRIQVNQESTLHISIKNQEDRIKEVSFSFNTTNPLVSIHYSNGTSLGKPEKIGHYYVTTYPVKKLLGKNEGWRVTLIVNAGLLAGDEGSDYSIKVELFGDGELSDHRIFTLEVNRT